jgi:hypothetical protein
LLARFLHTIQGSAPSREGFLHIIPKASTIFYPTIEGFQLVLLQVSLGDGRNNYRVQ